MQEFIIDKIITFDEEIDTMKKLQSFLGLVNQLRDYVPKLSDLLIELYKKVRKDQEFTWTEENKKQIQLVNLEK